MDELIHDRDFPGNQSAFDELVGQVSRERVIGFTGAGTSVPLAPTWPGLLKQIILEGVRRGLISIDDQNELEAQITEDPLELAATLEDHFVRESFRAYLASFFHLDGRFTPAHEALIRLPLNGIVTLNYDDGLSAAYANLERKMPRLIRSDEGYEITRWLHTNSLNSQLPILHLHGSATAPDRMIFTADDYNLLYSQHQISSLIEDLWRSKTILAVGFGFTDPFLTRLAEGVLRNLQTDRKHFGFIGTKLSHISTIKRKTFVRKYRMSPIFYKILESDAGGEDHTNLILLLQHLETCATAASQQTSLALTKEIKSEIDEQGNEAERAKRDFEAGLFIAPSGVPLYVEPTLAKVSAAGEVDLEPMTEYICLDDIVRSTRSYFIECSFEYGASTLARRLRYEFILLNKSCSIRNANDLPQYKAKLLADKIFTYSTDVLIIDDFNLIRHERLLKEIVGLNLIDRLIILAKSPGQGASATEDFSSYVDADHIYLCQMSRPDIRHIATRIYETFDADLVNAAVEKTYTDLLDLCIPLTPGNIVMYIKVLYKEGSFVPLNRLELIII